MRRKVVLLVVTAILAGCVRQGGTLVSDQQIAVFHDGSTTSGEVIAALGAPLTDIVDSRGLRTIGYSYVATQVSGATFVPVVGMFAGGATGQSRTVIFQFDGNGVLVSHTVASSQFH